MHYFTQTFLKNIISDFVPSANVLFFFTLQTLAILQLCGTTFIFLCLHINDPGDSEFCLQFYGHLNTAGPPIPQLK